MKYKVDMNKEVRKFLHSHPEVSARFISALEQIAQNPFDNALDIKKCKASPTNTACESANIACCMKSSMSRF